jgi:hypothetical protein
MAHLQSSLLDCEHKHIVKGYLTNIQFSSGDLIKYQHLSVAINLLSEELEIRV